MDNPSNQDVYDAVTDGLQKLGFELMIGYDGLDGIVQEYKHPKSGYRAKLIMEGVPRPVEADDLMSA